MKLGIRKLWILPLRKLGNYEKRCRMFFYHEDTENTKILMDVGGEGIEKLHRSSRLKFFN